MKQLILFLVLFGMFAYSTRSEATDEKNINLIFAGDTTLASHYQELVPDPSDTSYPLKNLQKIFKKADLVMVNCENPITTANKKRFKRFNFRMPPSLIPVFTDNNIKIVSLGNNHVYDFKEAGLLDTLNYLDQAGIKHVGAGKNLADARKPEFFEIKGKKIAFLAYGNYSPATPVKSGVACKKKEAILEDVRLAKKNGADVIIVSFHWGREYAKKPNAADKKLAHAVINAGANIIIGHHPHILQPIEYYHGGIIAYSLGNFIFGGNRKSYETAILRTVIQSNNALSYKIIPLGIDNKKNPYQPVLREEKK